MIYKLLSQTTEMSQQELVQASVDFRTDDTVVMIVASWFVQQPVDVQNAPVISFELSWLSQPQTTINDTQGQILTWFGGPNRFQDNTDAFRVVGQPAGQIVVPNLGIKVQSGERLYLNIQPLSQAESVLVYCAVQFFTTAGDTPRAIRRR